VAFVGGEGGGPSPQPSPKGRGSKEVISPRSALTPGPLRESTGERERDLLFCCRVAGQCLLSWGKPSGRRRCGAMPYTAATDRGRERVAAGRLWIAGWECDAAEPSCSVVTPGRAAAFLRQRRITPEPRVAVLRAREG
jgi:hypothetical protein